MGFLFGDSSKFPMDFNFLATLEKFMPCATKVVMLEAEDREQAKQAVDHGAARAMALEAVEALHEKLVRSFDAVLGDPTAGPHGTMTLDAQDAHPARVAYAKKIRDYAARIVEEQRESSLQANDGEALKCKTESDRREKDARREVETFLKSAQLELLTARVSFTLGETKNDAAAVVRTAGGIVIGFSLGAAKIPAWREPRKLSEFGTGLDLMVGIKKSFFKGVVTAEPLHLDDFVIGRADLNADVLLLSLRRKVDQKDSVVLKVRRTERGLTGDFDRPDEPNAKSIPSALSPEDLEKLQGVWKAIRAAFDELLPHKEAVTHLEMDGRDVFKEKLCLALVTRFIATFAPLVTEIARKSPNREELSLKIENEDGRREEIYLKKEILTKSLEPLNAIGRQVFTPLGLESWVPALSMRPPNVTIPT